VYYNVYENTVFCDWKRLVEGVELLATQPEENTTRDAANASITQGMSRSSNSLDKYRNNSSLRDAPQYANT
jgi:hypothetical protein